MARHTRSVRWHCGFVVRCSNIHRARVSVFASRQQGPFCRQRVFQDSCLPPPQVSFSYIPQYRSVSYAAAFIVITLSGLAFVRGICQHLWEYHVKPALAQGPIVEHTAAATKGTDTASRFPVTSDGKTNDAAPTGNSPSQIADSAATNTVANVEHPVESLVPNRPAHKRPPVLSQVLISGFRRILPSRIQTLTTTGQRYGNGMADRATPSHISAGCRCKLVVDFMAPRPIIPRHR
jgi:hypothetical protein